VPDRTEEKSPLEYAFLDGDTGEVLLDWATVYKTVELHRALYAARSKPVGIAMRSVTVWVRHPELPEHKIDPKELIDQGSTYFHDVQFPRRSGLRGKDPRLTD